MQPLTDFLVQYEFGLPLKVECSPVGETLDYKAVFWIWMAAIAKQLTDRGHPITADEVHDLVCHKFLGYTKPRTIGKTRIESALRTITYPKQLDRAAFYHFLREIEMWSSEIGVTLPENPSQYEQDKQRENAA